ncbi:MAG: right-handed parallel beta-helix repeat-containing protein [Chthoniobacteraceae bacterium]
MKLLAFLVLAASLSAAELRVGIDKEYPTIHHAIKAAQPGDTIHLENKVYRDYAGFYGKKGTPGRPITLDGHGAVLEGSDPLKSEQWREVAPGLFAAEELLARLDPAIIYRWFFLFDGRMQLMGCTSKGRHTPHKKPEDLQPGEWTFIQGPARPNSKPGQIYGTFFIKLEAGKKLTEANIAVPVRSAGVQFSGDNAHLVIKNLTATHPYNDGFNIHGDCRDVLFENIRAIECGDDGISAHESAQYRVNGFVSIGNSTGICDTGTAQTTYRDVFISGCHGHDLYFLDEGRYSITNALVLSGAENPFVVTGRDRGECHFTMENVLFRRLVEPRIGQIRARAIVKARACTFEGLDFKITGAAIFESSLVNGRPSEPNARGADTSLVQRLTPDSAP